MERRNDIKALRDEASAYLRNHKLLTEIKRAYMKNYIDRQEMLTLRGQALNGDSDGAIKGLARLMMRGDRRV